MHREVALIQIKKPEKFFFEAQARPTTMSAFAPLFGASGHPPSADFAELRRTPAFRAIEGPSPAAANRFGRGLLVARGRVSADRQLAFGSVMRILIGGS